MATRKARQIGIFLLPVILCTALLAPPQVWAHAAYSFTVPPRGPAPVIDGQCSSEIEYRDAMVLPLLYRPLLAFPAARILIFSNQTVTTLPGFLGPTVHSTSLHICITGLPIDPGVDRFVSVAFDVMHDAGRQPDTNDLRFTLYQSGLTNVERGTETGNFITDTEISNWEASAGFNFLPGNDIPHTWNAEFRISTRNIGNHANGSIKGFHVLHDFGGTIWPSGTVALIPNTWGDLIWPNLTAETQPTPRVDEVRITQGLEMDVTAAGAVATDLILGKSTLARARIYALGRESPPVTVTRADCVVTSPAAIARSYNIPPGIVNNRPAGYFNGDPTFDCWIPGQDIDREGYHRFQLHLVLMDGREALLDLGSRYFWPSSNLSVFLWPWENRRSDATIPGAGSNPRRWGDDLDRNAIMSMRQFQRLLPVRFGYASTSTDFSVRDDIGLRFLLSPFVPICTDRDPADCSSMTARSNDEFLRLNAQLEQFERLTGVRRERFTAGSRLEARTATAGGQAQCLPMAGSGIDADVDGASAFVIAQEILHLLDIVPDESPHTTGASHSRNRIIPAFRNLPMVNMLTREDVSDPLSVMFPTFSDATVPERLMLEGWDWNYLRELLLSTSYRPPCGDPGLAAGFSGNSFMQTENDGSLFHLVATIDKSDVVRMLYSKRSELPLQLTLADPDSPYELIFLDASGKHLAELRFPSPMHDHTHGGNEAATLILTALIPEGSAHARIQKSGEVLFDEYFSIEPPVISDLQIFDSAEGNIVRWMASDNDSDTLRFNVFFQREQDSILVPVASGLAVEELPLNLDRLPASGAARIIVEATDGLNTARAVSKPFVIDEGSPLAGIFGNLGQGDPSPDPMVAGQPFMLLGMGYDYTHGLLTGDALTWHSDIDGFLGVGEEREVRLSQGKHTITLSVMAPSGLTESENVEIVVLPDTDGDGLNDSFELQHPCLQALEPDGDDDPDGDSATTLLEKKRGSDPCEPDTDQDGISDGDEIRLASNPLDAQDVPTTNQLFVSIEPIDLGRCPSAKTQLVPVVALTEKTTWNVSTNVDWLVASANDRIGDGTIKVSANCEGLQKKGQYIGEVLISTTDASQLRVIEAHLN